MREINPAINPLIIELFRLMDEVDLSASEVARQAGISNVTLHYWKEGRMGPQMFLFDAALRPLGYRLRIEPVEGYIVKRPEHKPRGRRSYFKHWKTRGESNA
jgi:hypothetical protein